MVLNKIILLGILLKSLEAKITTQERVQKWESVIQELPLDDLSFRYKLAKQAYGLAWKS